MIKKFLNLNKNKVAFLLKATSLLFLSLASVGLILRYLFKDEFPDSFGLVLIILFAGIGFPIFILLVASVEWYLNRKAMDRVLSVAPFSALNEIGFELIPLGEYSKWYLTEEIMKGGINNFPVSVHVSRESKNLIEFRVPVVLHHLSKLEYKSFYKQYEKREIKFNAFGFSKIYDLKPNKLSTIRALQSDLENFIAEIKKEGFQPFPH